MVAITVVPLMRMTGTPVTSVVVAVLSMALTVRVLAIVVQPLSRPAVVAKPWTKSLYQLISFVATNFPPLVLKTSR